MQKLSPDVAARLRPACEREIVARDRELDNDFSKDAQVTAIRGRPGGTGATSSSGWRARTSCSTRRPAR